MRSASTLFRPKVVERRLLQHHVLYVVLIILHPCPSCKAGRPVPTLSTSLKIQAFLQRERRRPKERFSFSGVYRRRPPPCLAEHDQSLSAAKTRASRPKETFLRIAD